MICGKEQSHMYPEQKENEMVEFIQVIAYMGQLNRNDCLMAIIEFGKEDKE